MLMRLRRSFTILPRRTKFFSAADENGDPAGDPEIFDREFEVMSLDDFRDIFRNDETIRERVQTILSEYEYNKYNSMGRVPSKISPQDMQLLVEEGLTPHSRNKLLNYLFKREMDKRASKLRLMRQKEETRLRRASKLEEYAKRGTERTGLLDSNGDLIYGLWHNSLFCRIPEGMLKSGSSASRLRAAALFGRKLIFDFDFEDYMVKHNIKNAIEQVQESYGLNRFTYEDPFDIWFCNLKSDSFSAQYASMKAFQNLHSGSMITLKEDCFTNHFDKSKLVYLSPNAKEPLGKIHKTDDIYIVGVYNDKGHQQPLTYRKALKLGIRARSLPLDQHIVWQGASKSLCLNHVTGILLEVMANGGDWKAAFEKHIPKRKIKPLEVVAEEEQKRLAKLLRTRKETAKFSLRRDIDW